MTPWKLRRALLRQPKYSATFSQQERMVLGDCAAWLIDELYARARSAPKDELSEMTGIPSGHTEAPQNPGLYRLLPDFERAGDEEFDGDNSLLRSLHENDVITAKVTHLQVIAQHLGPDQEGEEVTLTEEEAQSFIAGLNDIRLYLFSLDADSQADSAPSYVMADKENVIEWLAFNQDSLLAALTGEH